MPEIKLQSAQNEAKTSLQEVTSSSSILESIAQRGIEIGDEEYISESLDVLRQDLGIEDEAFTDFKRTIVLVAAADRLAQLKKRDESVGVQGAEMEYIADLVMGIAGEYTAYHESRSPKTLDRYIPSEEHQKLVYEKYMHPELTAEFDEFIHGEAFDELRLRLGVDDEEPFEVKVLSIDTGDSDGLIPYVDFGEDQLSHEEFSARIKEGDIRRDYRQGLENRSVRFANELGRDGVFAPAWVSTFDDGTKYLCVTTALAEKVMYTDEERSAHYDESYYVGDLATAQHEYTHTQEMLTGGEISLGIALEELRAEHFSGNHQGYTDIKKFFIGMRMLTGYNPSDSFEINGQPYNQDNFLADIVRNVGLAGLIDAMTVMPSNYVSDEQVSPFVKSVVAHNGGSISSHFAKMHDRLTDEFGKEVIEARISDFVDNVYEKCKDNEYITVESWFSYGAPVSFRDVGIKNFRRRYPDKSDGYDYGV